MADDKNSGKARDLAKDMVKPAASPHTPMMAHHVGDKKLPPVKRTFWPIFRELSYRCDTNLTSHLGALCRQLETPRMSQKRP